MKNSIKNLLKDLKVRKGDNIIIHSNVAGIYQFSKKKQNLKKNLVLFFKNILNYIGKDGTVLVPAYNYDFTKGKNFDRKKSLSQVGELGNFLNREYPENRTFDPVFSHIVFGRLKDKIFSCDIKEAFGKKSVFDLILNKNFKILCFCCSPASMTFIHFLEKKLNVSYRYDKNFKSSITFKSKKIFVKYKYCVGKKNYNYNLKENKIINLLGKKLVNKNFGKFKCYQIGAKNLYKETKRELSNDKFFLIR